MNIKSIGSKIKGNPTMVEGTVYSMLIICSISHFLNDMIQSIIPSIYPIVKDKFGVSVQTSQLCLFVFLAAFAIGTVAGGMLGDKFGRKYVIWFTILGAAPFAIAMPFVNFTWTIIFTFLSGLIIASAFSSIVVYATDLMPDKVGLIAGIFFGLMFGLEGLGSAFFGWLADKTSIEFIFQVSAFLPLLGIIAGFLPNTQKRSVEETDENAK
jgi:FSR family fosmidomycin resistance protein-like MFS transporter